MGAAYFYHLTESPIEATLPTLIEKSRAAGWRVLVRGREMGLLQRLDQVLWERPVESFLPHGMAGGPHDAQQPVLLGVDTATEGFACVMAVGGAELTAAEVGLAERACILFDGADPEAVAHARSQWKALTADGCSAQYWAQESGRWTMKAET